MTLEEKISKFEKENKKYKKVLFKIYAAEYYSGMNQSCYECATILSNLAQDVLEIPYRKNDFSIADRYNWESSKADIKAKSDIDYNDIHKKITNTIRDEE